MDALLYGLLAGVGVLCFVVAFYAAIGVFDRPSPKDDLSPCPRCGRPVFALEYHLRKCKGVMVYSRHRAGFRPGERRY